MKIPVKVLLLILIILNAAVQSSAKLSKRRKAHNKDTNTLQSKHEHVDYQNSDYNGVDKDGKPFKMPEDLPDFNHDHQTELEEYKRVLLNHGLTNLEMRTLFNLNDYNKDGGLSYYEWKNFKNIFYDDFEKCDKDGDYYLKDKEMEECLKKTEFRFVGKKELKDYLKEIMGILQDDDKKVNFAGYVYLRKTALAWRQCVPGNYEMGRAAFKCATAVASMGKILSIGDFDSAFKVAILISGLKKSVPTITYPQFLRISWQYNTYLDFDVPIADGTITFKEMHRGLTEGMVPSKMNNAVVDSIYNALAPGDPYSVGVTFPTFAIIFTWWDKFYTETKGEVNADGAQFCKLIGDDILKYDVMRDVDACIHDLKDEDLEKASTSKYAKDSNLTEKDYIMLLQKKHHKAKTFNMLDRLIMQKRRGDCPKGKEEKHKPSKECRKILFYIVDGTNDNLVNFAEFVYFLKFAHSFEFLDIDQSGRVEGDFIDKRMIMKSAPIPMVRYEAEKIFDFALLEIRDKIGILQFLAYSNVENKFNDYLQKDTKNLVQAKTIKFILKYMNLKIIDRDLAAAAKGLPIDDDHDTLNYKLAFKISLKTHIRANQHKIDEEAEKAMK